MKRMFILLLMVLVLVGCTDKKSAKFTVGVIQFGDFASLNDTLDGIEDVLKDEDIKLVVKSAQGEAANVITIASQFVEDDVDLIVAITTQAAQAAVAASDGKIPVVFSAVSDPVSAGISDLKTVTGVSDIAPLEAQFELISDLTPDVKKIGVLFKTGDPNGMYQTERIKEISQKYDISIITKGALEVSDLSISANSLAQEVDAFYLITDSLIVGNTGVIVDEGERAGVVSFASEDGQFEQGVLASNSISYVEIGKQTAKMVKSILMDGMDPSEIEIEEAKQTYPQISKEVAEDFGIEVPDAYLEYIVE